MDIQFHDTYIIVSVWHASIVLALLALLIGWYYRSTKKTSGDSWLTTIHVAFSLFGLVGLWILAILFEPWIQQDPAHFSLYNKTVIVLIWLFLVVQLALPISFWLSKLKE